MSIRKGFLAIAITAIALLAAILYLIVLEVQNQRALAAAEARHYASFKLADELRQSSDDLTRMARTYVVTGEPIYKEYFRRILAIRNGEAQRPENYDGIYWDFVAATGEKPGPDGQPVALRTLMRRMGFTKEEFAKLQEAQDNSDELAGLEERAMAAVKGLYPDADGRYTVHGKPDMALARDLMHSPAYHRAKIAIMAPIGEFTEMVAARTQDEASVLRKRATTLVGTAIGLMVLAVGLMGLGFVLLQRRVVRPALELATAANRAESGEYDSRVPVRTEDEIGQLARAFNQMAGAIESDIKVRERTTAELAQARETADLANRAKSAFLANMSHELRTPMNAILGYSEMMIEEAEDVGQEDFIPDLKKINQAGTHLLALINDVLDLSKIESGKMEAFAETFVVDTLIDQVTGTAQPLMAKNSNHFTIERGDNLGSAHQDVTKVRQALLNLISNAAKFTHEDTVTLAVEREQADDGDWLTFAVKDSGIGIAPDKLDHVFEEFSQADNSTTRDYGGTGLGLPISRRFCQMLGGDLTLTSQVGKGSTFTIRLPAVLPGEDAPQQVSSQPAARTSAAAADKLQATPGSTILVIDDDAEACEIIRRFLEKDGFSVITALSGEEGLRLAHEIQPAAITLDVMMPDMDGWSVLRALKANPALHDIPIVMLTMIDDKSKGYSLGASDYLTKPVDRDQLHTVLARYYNPDEVCSVLLVEDDAATREMMTRTLEKSEWAVIEAGNGREALDQLAQNKPQLILLDLMMPVMDGFDFLLEMHANADWQDIPVIVLTAKDLTEEDRRMLSGRVEQIVEKGARAHEQVVNLIHQIVDLPPAGGHS